MSAWEENGAATTCAGGPAFVHTSSATISRAIRAGCRRAGTTDEANSKHRGGRWRRAVMGALTPIVDDQRRTVDVEGYLSPTIASPARSTFCLQAMDSLKLGYMFILRYRWVSLSLSLSLSLSAVLDQRVRHTMNHSLPSLLIISFPDTLFHVKPGPCRYVIKPWYPKNFFLLFYASVSRMISFLLSSYLVFQSRVHVQSIAIFFFSYLTRVDRWPLFSPVSGH